MKRLTLTRLLQLFFFLLPWQTRWMYDAVLIGGGANNFGILSVYATEILLGILFLWALPLRIPKGLRHVAFAAGGVVAASALSLFVAQDVSLAASGLVHLGCALFLFLLLLDERVALRPVLIAFVVGLFIPSLLGVFQAVTGASGASTWLGLAHRDAQQLGDAVLTLGDGSRLERAYGSFSHPNIFGGYLAVAILSLAWLRKSEKQEKWRRMFFEMMGWFTFVLVLTWSRSALLGLCAGFLFGTWSFSQNFFQKIRPHLFAMLVVLGVLVSVGLIYASSFTNGFTQPSVTERLAQYADYPEMMEGSWIFGHGVSTYSLTGSLVFPDRAWWLYQPIHNVPLLVVGEIGIFGLLCMLIFFKRLDRQQQTYLRAPAAMAGLSLLAALFPIAFLDHYLWSFWSGLALCAFVAACFVRLGEKEEQE